MSGGEFWVSLLIAVVLTLAIKFGFYLAGHWIHWLLAALLGFGITFGGFFWFDSSDGDLFR